MKLSYANIHNPTQINLRHPGKDILSGLIIALVSIPISMGYAQIAGLPAVYGLYGSFLPVLAFCLLTSSPQFVIGVDAMPAVMVGNLLTQLGIASMSDEALQVVPVITLLCAVWFVLFRLIRAGRAVKYISNPVMGGFISGIGCTIILMQVPKLFGGAAGTGELIPLIRHIAAQLPQFHPLSALLGLGTIGVIHIGKRLKPSIPMSVVTMVVGILLVAVFHLDAYGVKTLSAAPQGLPKLMIPDVRLFLRNPRDFLTVSLTISLVIMAQSLLATASTAAKNGYKTDQNRELVAYAAMNLAGCVVGCCPINGSVSRTGMSDQMGTKSQLMGLTAVVTMVVILLFGTGLLQYMPVPVLTGIVTTALIGIVERTMAKRLWKTDRMEFAIFLAAFCGVLLLGTIYGVVIGVALSFFDVIRIAVVPPRGFMGVLPGHEAFYALDRTGGAMPVRNTLIYRFSGNLFFANISTFRSDLEDAITEDTRTVIIDARGISDIDITAADSLLALYEDLKKQGIALYLTEHVGAVNDSLRRYGAGRMIEEGAVRRTIELALAAAGMEPPYPVQETDSPKEVSGALYEHHQLAEFEWLFGEDAEQQLRIAACEVAEQLTGGDDTEADESVLERAEQSSHWKHLSTADEDDLMLHLALRLEQLVDEGLLNPQRLQKLEQLIGERELKLDDRLQRVDPTVLAHIREHRERISAHAWEKNPERYRRHLELQERIRRQLEQHRSSASDDQE